MSEVLGTVLLVAITVAMVAGLGYLLMGQTGPVDSAHAEFMAFARSGADGQWNTGDEELVLAHTGGERLDRSDTHVRATLGTDTTEYRGAQLDGDWSDGLLLAGEEWILLTTIALGTALRVDVITDTGSGSDLSYTSAWTASCSGDVLAPVAGVISQSPQDVTTSTVGSVTVTMTFGDDCAGVDNAVAPTLFYRVNPGTNPAYASAGAMTLSGTNRWQGTIPDQTWSGHNGKTLEYYATGVQDALGRVGTSDVRQESLEPAGTMTYPSGSTATIGSVASFANAQSATDAGAAATLSESTVLATLNSRYASTSIASVGTGWTSAQNTGASDNLYETNANAAPTALRLDARDELLAPGTVTSVVIGAELSILSYANDAFQLRGCILTQCTAYSPNVGGSATDVTATYDISCRHPGSTDGVCGLWTWTDLNALQIDILPIVNGGVRDGTWRADHAYVQVGYTPTAGNRMAIEFAFAGVPAGTNRWVQVQYHATQDLFQIQVYDGAAWNNKGLLLASPTPTLAQVSLTSAEYLAGAPRIRFVDTESFQPSGTLVVDYARVKTT